jgi:hypothetical protein
MKNNLHEWYLAKDKLPKENTPILFKPKEETKRMNVIYLGEYIKSDNMFYIGIEDSGDFLFAFDVYKWCYLSDYVEQLNY